jgi:hydroxyethylthiazole kinase
VAPDPLTGLVSANVHFSVAAELAEAVASKPGSFATAFIDALDTVDEISLRSRVKIQPAFSSSNLEPSSHIELLGAVV